MVNYAILVWIKLTLYLISYKKFIIDHNITLTLVKLTMPFVHLATFSLSGWSCLRVFFVICDPLGVIHKSLKMVSQATMVDKIDHEK